MGSWADDRPMTMARQEMARRAEQLVARYLMRKGFRIVGMNVRAGRLELDVVAERLGVTPPALLKRFGSRLTVVRPAANH